MHASMCMLYVELVSRDFANSDEICRSCTIRSVNGTSDILLFSPFFSFSPTLLRISYVALKYRVDTVFSGRRYYECHTSKTLPTRTS